MKKNKPINKLHLSLAVISILAVTFTYQYFKKIQIREFREIAKNEKNIKSNSKDIKRMDKVQKRKIASIPKSSVITKFQNRQIVGSLNQQKDFPINNKVNKEWKKLAYNRLNKMTDKKIKIEIRPVAPILFVKHNMGRYVEHVKVILKKENGLRSAYDAYVDSQSGAIVRTWNRTKFEVKPKLRIQSQGNEFVGLPLNKVKGTSI